MRIAKRLRAKIEAVRAKRPRTLLDHILTHGYVTTQELRDKYGYNHPPRAARDVRECGIPIETFRVTGSDGRSIGAYRLASARGASVAGRQGRAALPRALKLALIAAAGEQCQICGLRADSRYLQVDHRVPYEIGGEPADPESRPQDFMLLCGSCNRAKSWSCEHCPNHRLGRAVRVCRRCYWARPHSYEHIATVPHRRVDLVWAGPAAVARFERLARLADEQDVSVRDLVLRILARSLT